MSDKSKKIDQKKNSENATPASLLDLTGREGVIAKESFEILPILQPELHIQTPSRSPSTSDKQMNYSMKEKIHTFFSFVSNLKTKISQNLSKMVGKKMENSYIPKKPDNQSPKNRNFADFGFLKSTIHSVENEKEEDSMAPYFKTPDEL